MREKRRCYNCWHYFVNSDLERLCVDFGADGKPAKCHKRLGNAYEGQGKHCPRWEKMTGDSK